MKKNKVIIFLCIISIVGFFIVKEDVSYSQDNVQKGLTIVDKPRAIVNKNKNYTEVTSLNRKGITGIIILTGEKLKDKDINLLKELAIRGYNIYIMEINKLHTSEELVKKASENINWIVVGKGEEVNILETWMKKNKYRVGMYGDYEKFNDSKITINENVIKLNNELNKLRNNI